MNYRVIFRGEVDAGAHMNDVKQRLAALLKTDLQKIDNLFTGESKVIKKDSDRESCEKIRVAFKQAGAVCFVEQQKTSRAENSAKNFSPDPTGQPPPLPSPQKRITSGVSRRDRVRRADEKFCESCGQVIKLNSLACPDCGKKQKEEGMGCLPKAAIALGVGFLGMAFLGILAAIAIPNFIAYRTKAFETVVRSDLQNLVEAQEAYFTNHDVYADTLEKLKFVPSQPQIRVRIVEAGESCFVARGTHVRLRHILWADCHGVKADKTRKSSGD